MTWTKAHLVAIAALALTSACAAPGADASSDETVVDVDPVASSGVAPQSVREYRPDLQPKLAISGDDYDFIYPNPLVAVYNMGSAPSAPSKLKYECFEYNAGGYYIGQCFGTMTFNVPSLTYGQYYAAPQPFVPGPMSCQAAKCVVRLTADSANTVTESNENNNVVEKVKLVP